MKTTDIEQELKKLEKIIVTGRSFFLAGHVNPDGDTIGSMLAISSVLKRLGKRVYLFSNDPVPENLRFLPHTNTIRTGRLPPGHKFDAAILLECSTPGRAGDLTAVLKCCGKVVNIDHHKTAELYGDVNIVEPHSSSTAEIVHRLFYNMNVKITKTEAACLYVGIVTDTGRFHFPATSPRTLEAASRLLETGFNFSRINDHLYATKSYPALKLLGRTLESLELVAGGRVAFMTLKTSDFTDCKAAPEHTENVINYGMMPPGVKAAALFRQEKARLSVTFRSKARIDVSVLAHALGGGGHRNAAGCKLNMDLNEAKKIVRAGLIKLLDKTS
ncbi:MAG: bifunctional oligoribonuclease/PAP phosphatase NrnA [Elusimicrobia bacterium]|nr:bifunctional oligoribonuclease/PAP phosphatase NrnA [Elusimicrobiota bacterium]